MCQHGKERESKWPNEALTQAFTRGYSFRDALKLIINNLLPLHINPPPTHTKMHHIFIRQINKLPNELSIQFAPTAYCNWLQISVYTGSVPVYFLMEFSLFMIYYMQILSGTTVHNCQFPISLPTCDCIGFLNTQSALLLPETDQTKPRISTGLKYLVANVFCRKFALTSDSLSMSNVYRPFFFVSSRFLGHTE